MSDAPIRPLEEARHLLDEICQQADSTLQQRLTELDRLLAAAQRSGEGEDAEGLRQRMEELIVTNAQFMSVMVHEIRVPMTSIRGYSDMLSKHVVGELNDMQQQFVDTIHANVLRMEHLVSDISDISKLKAGRMHLEPKTELYRDVALQVEKDAEELAAAHRHTLAFETPSDLPLLKVDGVRLAQALKKLVVNALQYTPDGGQITVRAEGIDGRVKVSVIDSGVGMTEEERTHVGEPFWRADNEHVRSFRGHGLGLPIAIGFIELMGGEFFFESAAGKGSTFGFIVPSAS